VDLNDYDAAAAAGNASGGLVRTLHRLPESLSTAKSASHDLAAAR